MRRKTGSNAFGEQLEQWTPIDTVWAHVAPVSDGERWRAGETLASKLLRFTIRYSAAASAMDPRDQFTYDGRVYDIQGIKELGRREFLEITAAARAETP